MLDADNQLVPSGIAALHASAFQTQAALAYGNIIRVDESGSVKDVMSNERVTPEILNRNWIDAMALVRTERVLALRGYETQWLYGLEDWELNQRLFSLGERMVHVPVLVGKYVISPRSMLNEAPMSLRNRRNQRIFGSAAAASSATYRACVHHPAFGTIWASPGWQAHEPAPSPEAVPAGGRPALRILVVSSGGVRTTATTPFCSPL